MKLMVIDGNSIMNRAFYGIRMLNAPDGLPTNAIYGFLTILNSLFDNGNSADYLCVCFDLPGPTFRHEQYDQYKAQRKEMPEELRLQMPVIKVTLDAMGISRCELEGWEADDLIGTIAKRCEAQGIECSIVTGDKDSFQLITELTHVKHIKSRMGQTEKIDYDPARFIEEYGFEPIKIIDLKALMGDSSDNIPGVAGVGEKTATDIVRRYGTVENIYENLSDLDIKDGVRKKLEAGRDSAFMSYELATIKTDAPIEFSPDKALYSGPGAGTYTQFKRLGFIKLMEKWGITESAESGSKSEKSHTQLERVEHAAIAELEPAVRAAEYISVLPLEGLDALEICDGKKVYDLRWQTAGDGYNDFLLLLFSPEVKKISHNVKDLMGLVLTEGISAEGFVFDTALAAYLLEPTESTYAIDRIAQKYLADDTQQSQAVFELYPVLDKRLRELEMEKLLYEIELPLCAVLADMEHIGFSADKAALGEFGDMLSGKINTLQKQIWDLAGEEFNINSPKQLGVILFERLMLPHGKKTKTGWSTNVDVLEKLADKHEIIKGILEYRQLSKLKSTYADGLQKVIEKDGRIHTSFQMTVTATGRLSSTEPNLQNIPVRTELGAEIRKMFIAPEGKVLVDADYSQIELRLLAHISDDETMKNAFLNNEDIHAVTASQVFNIPFAEVTPLMRSRAKAVNFGIVYGISAFSLAQDISVYQNEAKEYIDAYLEKYHGVREYMKNIVEQARRDGYVSTLYGRRRNLPELKSSNFNMRSFGERVALNMPIQGTAADIMKIAMINVHSRLKAERLEARLILQVHDELIAECPENEAEKVMAVLTEEMERAASLSVPLIAEAHAGKSWHEAK